MKSSKGFWDKTASSYDQAEEKDHVVYKKIFDATKVYLSRDKTMLDVGCGTGALHQVISSRVKHIHGIDYSEGMIEIAKEKVMKSNLENVSYTCLELQALDSLNQTFDLVIAFYTLHLFDSLESTLVNIKSVLDDQGYFISVTPCMKESKFLGLLLEIGGKIGLLPKMNRFTHEALIATFKQYDFEILEAIRISDKSPEYFVVARKPLEYQL